MHTTHTHTHTPLHSLRTSVYTLCYAIGRRGLYTHHQHGSVWRRIHKSHSSMRKFHEGNDPTYCPTSSTLPPLALYGTPHNCSALWPFILRCAPPSFGTNTHRWYAGYFCSSLIYEDPSAAASENTISIHVHVHMYLMEVNKVEFTTIDCSFTNEIHGHSHCTLIYPHNKNSLRKYLFYSAQWSYNPHGALYGNLHWSPWWQLML